MKRLPIDINSLEIMLSENYLYVDKTEIVYDLITRGRYYFLSRPRRFGKSLFISTLREIFLGNKSLFKDLWIGKSDYDWKSYPVIYLDFSNLDIDSAKALKASLSLELDVIGNHYGIDLQNFPTPGSKLKGGKVKVEMQHPIFSICNCPLRSGLHPCILSLSLKILLSCETFQLKKS